MIPLPIAVLLKHLHGSHIVILPLDHFADFDDVQVREEGAFALYFALGEVERGHGACEAVGGVAWLYDVVATGGIGVGEALEGDPRVFQALVDGDAFVNVDGEHAVDEVERWIADAVPIRGRVVEAAHFDLLGEVVGVFVGPEFVAEGGEAAEADVEDDAEGPDVHGASVSAAFAVFEDLGGDIGRGAAQGGREGFFADDLGEAEVGQFDGEVFVSQEDVFGLDVAVHDVALMLR